MSALRFPSQEYITPSQITPDHVDEIMRVLSGDVTTKMIARMMLVDSNGKYDPASLLGLGLKTDRGDIIDQLYFLEIYVSIGFQKMVSQAMSDLDLRTQIIHNTNKRDDILKGVFVDYVDKNLCRDNRGKLFTKTALTHYLKNEENCEQLMSSALIHGDVQALELLLTHKYLKKYQSKLELVSFCSSKKITPHPIHQIECQERLTDSAYLRKILALEGAELKGFIENDQRPELVMKHGSLVIESLFRSGKSVRDKALSDLLTAWIAHGVDWYEGMANAFGSPLDRVDVANREKQPLREIADLLDKKAENSSLCALILKALPAELKIAYCTTPAEANKLYKVTKDEYLRPYVSKSLLREEINSGFDI